MPYPDGAFNGGDIVAYQWLVADVPTNGTIVELGCYKGRSICSVSAIIRAKNLRTILVDKFLGLPSNSRHTEVQSGVSYEDPVALRDTLEMNIEAYDLDATIFEMDSAEAAAMFGDEMIDLVFIDADHQYDAVLRDLEAWWPKITPVGRISGHDYSWTYLFENSKTRKIGASGGYEVATALRDFFQMQREIKRCPRQQQSTLWYVNKDASDDLVYRILSVSHLDLYFQGRLLDRATRVLEGIRELGFPTREKAVFECSRIAGCSTATALQFITRLMQCGHIQLVEREIATHLA